MFSLAMVSAWAKHTLSGRAFFGNLRYPVYCAHLVNIGVSEISVSGDCNRLHNGFRHQWNPIEANAGRIFDRVENRRRWTIHR